MNNHHHGTMQRAGGSDEPEWISDSVQNRAVGETITIVCPKNRSFDISIALAG